MVAGAAVEAEVFAGAEVDVGAVGAFAVSPMGSSAHPPFYNAL